MSSPLSSLKKSHKVPLLPGAGHRPVPFRNPDYSEDESRLLDEVTTGMVSSRTRGRDPFSGLPKIESRTSTHMSTSPREQGVLGATPSDRELLSLMMSRVSQLETKVQFQNKELLDKDKRNRVLEDKLRLLQKAQDARVSSGKAEELERKCLLLQQQVHEMEAFLADYGMIWVGEKPDPESEVYHDDSSLSSGEEVWRPGSSVSRVPEYSIDFERILENIRDLNVLAGEGEARIQRTVDGARLKVQEPIPITFYANGMALFSGPFRPYSDEATQTCIKDLYDGYFPSELQNRYPDGVPFRVTDLRKVMFDNKRELSLFTGSGQTLGGETKPSRLVPSNLNRERREKSSSSGSSLTMSREVTNLLPGPQLTMEQFLNKLPSTVVKQGRVIDIRNSVSDQMQGGDRQASVVIVETEATSDMKKRMELDEHERPPSARNVTTLRIKSESGDQTFIIKMRFYDTIGDLRTCLNKQRRGLSSQYQIMSAYPHRIYDDDSLTLEECALTPNAVLHLRPSKKS